MKYEYNVKQNKAAVDYQDGLFKSAYTYDNSNNLSSITYNKGGVTNPFLTFDYEYDKSGNITKQTDKDGVAQYSYDNNDQLIKEILPSGSSNEYTYDRVGNRTKYVKNGTEFKYVYNDGNQILTKNNINFSYDSDGNLTQDDNYKYEYNELGAQTSVKTLANSLVAKYEYDEDGLRTKKIIGSKVYEYYYDGEDDNLVLVVTKDNNEVQQYLYYQWDNTGKAVGMIIKDKDAAGSWKSNTYYFLTNQRGDVKSIVDSKGVEVGSYTYDAYGNLLTETGNIAKINSIRYASYYYDSETKHYYLKARYYDPSNGNFLALDPHPGDEDDSLSQNGYTYAGNNPVIQVDPDGDFFWVAVNVGWAAYSGYRAYKRGGWKSAAVAAGVGLVGGAAWKVGRVAYRAYQARKVTRIAKRMSKDSGAAKHMNNSSRWVSRYHQASTIVYGKRTRDGARGYSNYHSSIYRNGKKYKMKVTYNKRTKIVRHFHYDK